MHPKIKIAFVTQFCPPYHRGFFELISQGYAVDFFFFGGDMSARKVDRSIRDSWGRLGNFEGRYLKGFYLLPNLRVTPSLIYWLLRKKYDIFVKCHNGRFALPVTFLTAKLLRKPFVLHTAFWFHPTTIFHRLSFFFMKFIYKYSDAIYVSGKHVRDYLVSLGIKREKIFIYDCVVDNSLFNQNIPDEEKKALRRQLGLSNERVILYVGRLAEEKGLDYLLEAFAGLYNLNASLVLVGEGHKKDYLERIVKEKNLKDVIFVGYVPNNKLCVYYAMADIFVLPSIRTRQAREAWGIVINEAMNQRLPIVATEDVGAAAAGFVQNGVNGFIVPSRNAQAMRETIETLLSSPELRDSMGKKSWEIIKDWTYDKRKLLEFEKAIKYALKGELPC